HHQNIVEGLEILWLELAAALRADIHSPSLRRILGPAVRRRAHMPVGRRGGFHLDMLQAALGDALSHHPLAQRRTADIAQTDEEYPDHTASLLASAPWYRKAKGGSTVAAPTPVYRRARF